ncbi:MAG: hypothetical protein JNK64_27310 [Myxococcales bacterium]|nr:hypothetical protein [Myxococcales bacterium]
MDDYDDYGGGPSPLRMFNLFSMLAPMAGMVLFASLWGVAILYVIARWRHHRSGVVDGQLGLKFVLHLFRLHGYQLLLLGGFMLLYSILAKGNSDMRSPIWRAAMGFLTAGGVVFGAHTVLLMKTNQAEQPLMGRMYSGLSLLITGLIAMTGLVLGTQALFAKGDMGNEGRGFWSLVFVYGTAWVVQGAVFGRAQLTGPSPDGPGAPGAPPPPPPPMPEPMRQPLA